MSRLRSTTCFTALGFLAASVALAAPPAKRIVVVGQNDPLIDRPAIQAAIDAVAKNGTVELVGLFQLDGVELFLDRGHLTVEGRVIDDDGDGRSNEDWPDGLDNDGDGAVDEDGWDAVLQGILTPGGAPAEGPNGAVDLFNRGLALRGVTGVARSITVRDLEFSGLARGVGFGADVRVAPGLLCADMVATGGIVTNSVVERNLFVNMLRGIQIFGASDGLHFRDNRFLDSAGAGAPLLLAGGAQFCEENDGSASGFPIGRPLRTHIYRNSVTHHPGYAVLVASADATDVRDNTLRSVTNGVLIEDAPYSQVLSNRVEGAARWGILAFDGPGESSVGSQIRNNVVLDVTGFWPVGLLGTAGIDASHNATSGSGQPDDYYLDGDSAGNTIILNSGEQTVLDLGTGNHILGGE